MLNICGILKFQINYTAQNRTLARKVNSLHCYAGNVGLLFVFVTPGLDHGDFYIIPCYA